MQEFDEIWLLVLGELRKKHSETFVSLWISDLKLISLSETTAVFYTPSSFKRDMLEKKHAETMIQALESVIGYKVDVVFTLNENPSQAMPEKTEPVIEATPVIEPSPTKEGPAETVSEQTAQADEPTFYSTGENSVLPQNPSGSFHSSEYTFENFIVGSSNKFAYATCTAVAQEPKSLYNPLFIHGPSGLGKTHLLYAITNEVHKNHPDYNIVYVKGEEFANQMIESIARGNTSQFREKYRKADVLLIDDIHFIAGKEATQEEFFHTFNDLHQNNKQIILTSDRPARDIQKLEERLRTRFEWGMSADIQPPDFELRIAIMKKKAETLGKPFPNDVLNFLAEKLTNNIRQMEGAIKKISAYSFLSGEEITIPLATACVSDLISGSGTVRVTPEKIISKVAAKYGVDYNDILSNKRTNEVAQARHMSIYLMRKILDMSYPTIGKKFGRDHTTIMSSYKLVEKEIKNNSLFELEINEFIKDINN